MNPWSRRLFLRRFGLGTASAMGLRLSARHRTTSEVPVSPFPFSDRAVRIADLLIETPRGEIFERLAPEIKAGATYLDTMAGVLLAGTREINPRPVGFKLHAVMMVGSALDLAHQADPRDRWLPVLWNADDFKRSQERDRYGQDWTMPEPPTVIGLPMERARARLRDALDTWDESIIDAAVTEFFHQASMDDFFEVLWPYGARCFSHIGHKAIYTAQAYRALCYLDWRSCGLPLMRSLANSLLAEGPGRHAEVFSRNRNLADGIRSDWERGVEDPEQSLALLEFLRSGTPQGAAEKVADLLNKGLAPRSLWDGIRLHASEMLLNDPGVLPVHPTTATNALAIGYNASRNPETRRLLLLQAASWQTMYREALGRRRWSPGQNRQIDGLVPVEGKDALSVEAVFDEVARDASNGQRALLRFLQRNEDAPAAMTEIRTALFKKGREHHQYKYAAAIFQEFVSAHPRWAPRLLASGLAYLPNRADRDSEVYRRAEALVQTL